MDFKLSWCRKLDNAEEKTHPSTVFSSEKTKNSRRLHPLLDSLSVVACTCGGTYKGYGGRGSRIRDRRRRDGRESEEGAAIIRHALVVKRTDSATLLFTICLLIVQQVLTTYNDAGDRKAQQYDYECAGKQHDRAGVGVVTTEFPAIASLHPAGEVCAPRVPPQIAWTVARERGRERKREEERQTQQTEAQEASSSLSMPFFFFDHSSSALASSCD